MKLKEMFGKFAEKHPVTATIGSIAALSVGATLFTAAVGFPIGEYQHNKKEAGDNIYNALAISSMAAPVGVTTNRMEPLLNQSKILNPVHAQGEVMAVLGATAEKRGVSVDKVIGDTTVSVQHFAESHGEKFTPPQDSRQLNSMIHCAAANGMLDEAGGNMLDYLKRGYAWQKDKFYDTNYLGSIGGEKAEQALVDHLKIIMPVKTNNTLEME